MLIMTSAGAYQVVQAPDSPDRLSVYSYDRESAQTAIDGLEMLYGEVCEIERPNGGYAFTVSREHFADWVAEEVRQYLNYEIFELALNDSRGENWLDAHSDIKMALMNKTYK